jgi:hypothetical protein
LYLIEVLNNLTFIIHTNKIGDIGMKFLELVLSKLIKLNDLILRLETNKIRDIGAEKIVKYL